MGSSRAGKSGGQSGYAGATALHDLIDSLKRNVQQRDNTIHQLRVRVRELEVLAGLRQPKPGSALTCLWCKRDISEPGCCYGPGSLGAYNPMGHMVPTEVGVTANTFAWTFTTEIPAVRSING